MWYNAQGLRWSERFDTVTMEQQDAELAVRADPEDIIQEQRLSSFFEQDLSEQLRDLKCVNNIYFSTYVYYFILFEGIV